MHAKKSRFLPVVLKEKQHYRDGQQGFFSKYTWAVDPVHFILVMTAFSYR